MRAFFVRGETGESPASIWLDALLGLGHCGELR